MGKLEDISSELAEYARRDEAWSAIARGDRHFTFLLSEVIRLALANALAGLVMTPPNLDSGSKQSKLPQQDGLLLDLLDLRSRQLVIGGQPVALTKLEFGVLKALLLEKGHVVEREALLEAVWPMSSRDVVSINVVDKTVQSLRKKLLHKRALIETVRGHGYRIRAGGVGVDGWELNRPG